MPDYLVKSESLFFIAEQADGRMMRQRRERIPRKNFFLGWEVVELEHLKFSSCFAVSTPNPLMKQFRNDRNRFLLLFFRGKANMEQVGFSFEAMLILLGACKGFVGWEWFAKDVKVDENFFLTLWSWSSQHSRDTLWIVFDVSSR